MLKQKDKTKRKYKVLVGNGCHSAIAEVVGIFIPSPIPSETPDKHTLLLINGTEITCSFKSKAAGKTALNAAIGTHVFRGYPKVNSDGKLEHLELTCIDPTDSMFKRTILRNQSICFSFIGLWTPQKTLTVQRSMAVKDNRKQVFSTGYLPKYKYKFSNSYDYKRFLWSGYVYQVYATLDGDKLQLLKVEPYACPRTKPENPTKKSNNARPTKTYKQNSRSMRKPRPVKAN